MTNDAYAALLAPRGFEAVAPTGERLPAPALGALASMTMQLLAARRHVGSATIDVQLQEGWLRTGAQVNRVAAARIGHAGIRGAAMIRAKPTTGLRRSLGRLPLLNKILMWVFLLPLLLVGGWILMVPWILWMSSVRKAALNRLGLRELPSLGTSASSGSLMVWGGDEATARAAVSSALLDALASTGWFGTVEIRPGEMLLESPVLGVFRSDVDLFGSFLDATVRSAEVIGRA